MTKRVKDTKGENTCLSVVQRKRKNLAPFDDISNELTGSLCLFTRWAGPEAGGTKWRQVHIGHFAIENRNYCLVIV